MYACIAEDGHTFLLPLVRSFLLFLLLLFKTPCDAEGAGNMADATREIGAQRAEEFPTRRAFQTRIQWEHSPLLEGMDTPNLHSFPSLDPSFSYHFAFTVSPFSGSLPSRLAHERMELAASPIRATYSYPREVATEARASA